MNKVMLHFCDLLLGSIDHNTFVSLINNELKTNSELITNSVFHKMLAVVAIGRSTRLSVIGDRLLEVDDQTGEEVDNADKE